MCRCRTTSHDAYHGAIHRALAEKPAVVVLDIGAGCGLLSMMAARAGAQRVVGCEANPSILKAGKEIVALNSFGDRITLVEKDCRNMKVPDDLPRRADLAIFELFDCSLIGEGILHFLAYAREHLLAEDARYLPAAARIRAMVIEYRLDRIWDIDANLLNPYRASPAFINVDAAKLPYRALTEPFDVFAFDFANACPASQEKELRLPAVAPGTAGAVLFWFDLGLDESCWISNGPHGGNQLTGARAAIPAGSANRSGGSRRSSSPRWLEIPGGRTRCPRRRSRLPRYDPRARRQRRTRTQTRNLLQQCAQNPDEYAKVARRQAPPSIRGPRARPAIAQRFASFF
jgi:type II protein arginine methyltransferase